mmetsp:Transcript_27223/g.27727  ORF Transcript_27223/g.27727 Transcript_27223/m.27727 type:complete len:97 (-) Transcript_27223:179-469(-)
MSRIQNRTKSIKVITIRITIHVQHSFDYRPHKNSINDDAITFFPDAVQKAAAEFPSSTTTKSWNGRGNNHKRNKKKGMIKQSFLIPIKKHQKNYQN